MYRHPSSVREDGTGPVVLAADRRGDYDEAEAGARGGAANEASGDQASRGKAGDAADSATLAAAIRTLAARARRLAADDQLDDLDGESAAAVLEDVHGLKAATAGLEARLVAVCQQARTCEADGAKDTTAWLKDTFRMSGRRAKKTAERARRMRRLPETSQALAAGDISEEHADILTRAARDRKLGDSRQTEHALLGHARRQSPDQLRATVRRLEQAADTDALADRERLARMRRSVNLSQRADGMWSGSLLLDPLSGEAVKTAIEAFAQPDPADTPRGSRRSPGQRRADGLVAAAQAALAAGQAATCGGARPQVSVLVPYETIAENGTKPAEAAYSGPLSPQVVRQLACDATITRIIWQAPSQILDVGRATQTWSAPQRRAVIAADGHCRWPGCDAPAVWCAIHHVVFWADDGHTKIANGCLLCWFHHTRAHSRGFTLDMDPTTRTVTVTYPGGQTRTSQPAGAAGRLSGDPDPPRSAGATAETTSEPGVEPAADIGIDPGPHDDHPSPPHQPDNGQSPTPRNSGTDPPRLPGL